MDGCFPLYLKPSVKLLAEGTTINYDKVISHVCNLIYVPPGKQDMVKNNNSAFLERK